jgi:hypothetical protein
VLRYSHFVCDDLTLFLQAKRENREYRISPEQNREGVYYDSSTPVLTGITWKNQSSPFAISFGLGADVSRSFRIEDNAGREIITRSGDIAPMASLIVKAGF